MATIRERTLTPDKKGKARRAYLVRYRAPGGQERSQQFRRKGDAERFARSVEVDKDRSEYVDPRSGKITLNKWWSDWWPTVAHALADNTRARDEATYRNHVRPRFGAMPLSAIEHIEIAKWLAELTASGLAAETVQKCHQALRKPLAAAVVDEKLRHNPADNVTLPKIEHGDKRVLVASEVEALADAIDPRYRLFVWLAAYCGLREGEIAGLKWGAVDTGTGWLRVEQQVTETAGVLKVTRTLKTKAAKRRVPIPRFLCMTLDFERDNAADDDFVVPNSDGGPLRISKFRSRYFVPAWKKAKIGKVTPHELRHTCVTRWVDQGANPIQVKTWAGHSSVATILDLYGHHEDAAAESVRDNMDAYATKLPE